MRKHLWAAAAAAALASAFPAAASATIVFATYQGTVNGYDFGDFGSLGSINARSFTLTYLFDTNVGAQPSGNELFGGSVTGTASPSLGATLTIDGHDVHYAGSYLGQDFASSTTRSADVRDDNFSRFVRAYVISPSGRLPTGLETSFNVAVVPAMSTGWDFIFNNSYGYLHVTNVSGGVYTGAVPEPATWGLMLIGFGATGLAMRRRAAVRHRTRFA